MGGGGSALAMIQSIKYNKSLLKGPRTYSSIKNYMQGKYNRRAHQSEKAYQGKQVPQAELEEIKRKIKEDLRKQNRRANIIIYSSTAIVLIILAIAILY